MVIKMRKIINGKKYDTDTARVICMFDNCENGVFSYTKILYRKKTGEFFYYKEGGPMSIDGSEIEPISLEEAKGFIERNGDADVYEREFGEVEE